ncbi:hypothetical protein EV424DRAFT_1342905 [Suillus variegatus]|nr:hypothetical protein EV424DRAFT_1342905 [Suillus variegatus]
MSEKSYVDKQSWHAPCVAFTVKSLYSAPPCQAPMMACQKPRLGWAYYISAASNLVHAASDYEQTLELIDNIILDSEWGTNMFVGQDHLSKKTTTLRRHGKHTPNINSKIHALCMKIWIAECALILAHDNLIVEDTLDQGKHKVMLMLNHTTNKMSNTGTAFSSGNWKTDTITYME